ncbi:MAG: hypothetical protein AAF329_13325, partial [Cyanobacteria bacterium P01_A01_bin.17]
MVKYRFLRVAVAYDRRPIARVGATLTVVAALLIGAPPPPTLGQEPPPVTAPASEPDTTEYFADVVVKGRSVFQVGSLSDLEASKRAAIINRRIASVLARDDIGDVTLQSVREVTTLQLNNRVLMTVTRQDAEDYGLSVKDLAENWAERLNQSLEAPPLAIDVVQRLNAT